MVSNCTAIGFTDKGIEKWSSQSSKLFVQCIGLPPYPGTTFPRVAGLVRTSNKSKIGPLNPKSVVGTALSPRGRGKKLIVQVVNDKTPNWGGKGFATALRSKIPHAQEDFQDWVSDNRKNLKLGNFRLTWVEDSLGVFSMIAQKGYGSSEKPRIRYAALEACLYELGQVAKKLEASVHMPKIGTGYAGGNWKIIEELIVEKLCNLGVSVTIYRLSQKNEELQQNLDFA